MHFWNRLRITVWQTPSSHSPWRMSVMSSWKSQSIAFSKCYASWSLQRLVGHTLSLIGCWKNTQTFSHTLLPQSWTPLLRSSGCPVYGSSPMTPIPKKKPVKDLKKDLCPISLTPCISKIAEDVAVCDYVKPAALQVLDATSSEQFRSPLPHWPC